MAKHAGAICFAFFFLAAVGFNGFVRAHGVGEMGERPLDWQSDQISQVMGMGDLEGADAAVVEIEGKRCLFGSRFEISVRDSFAFDVDEAVDLEVEFHSPAGVRQIAVSYDAATTAPQSLIYAVSEPVDKRFQFSNFGNGRWQRRTLTLPRARFANRGPAGSDLVIYSTDRSPSGLGRRQITICDIQLTRSFATQIPRASGRVLLEVTDELGNATPVRTGIYTEDGRSPLPNEEAVPLRYFDDLVRVLMLRSGTAWPVMNRSVFYINGRYQAMLPVGKYELVVSKGPEYRMVRELFDIKENETTPLRVRLARWDNMPKKGWYSGDGHIHYARPSKHDDANIFTFAEAEGLHVANLLQMGNSANVHFRQHAWEKIWRGNDTVVLAPGQEDPRTTHRGHTVHLDLKGPVRDPEHYLQYETVFERVRAQGGVSGYAHASDVYDFPMTDGHGHRRGMLLDVPFGLVDFLEVLQFGAANTKTWFDFLNLGYKLSPMAGTDYPYIDVPGIVRAYVHIDGEFTPQSWFDGLKQGRVFVTDGPMLELEANGQSMGSELKISQGDELEIRGRARLNPDFGRLARLVLIEQGEVVKTVSAVGGAEKLELDFNVTAKHGTWFVLRAEVGKPKKGAAGVALSAPVYVSVDGKGFWKPAAVPEVVAALKRDMQAMLEPSDIDPEIRETREPNRAHWAANRKLLQRRIEQVGVIYDDLLKRAELALAEEEEQKLAARRSEGKVPAMAK